MRRLSRIMMLTGAAIIALFTLGPYEPVEGAARFEPRKFGEGVQVYFETIESGVKNLRPGAEKRVVWAGLPETRTPLAIVYLHGFSASAAEIRPVPDRVAQALGANLVYTRLRGHGRDGDAMAEGSVPAWMRDVSEALEAGRAVGDELIVIATSTGGSLATVAAADPVLSERLRGMVLVSPNFGIQNPMAPLLTWPAARHWLPLLAGQRRSFEPLNDGQARHWTTEYPSVAVFPMAALVRHAARLDHAAITLPVLFYYSQADKVVDPAATAAVAARWGGPVTTVHPQLQDGDDPFAHVVAGEIMSPGNTDRAVESILHWIAELG